MVAIIFSLEVIVWIVVWTHFGIRCCWCLVFLNHRRNYLSWPVTFSCCFTQNVYMVFQLPKVFVNIFPTQWYCVTWISPDIEWNCTFRNYCVFISLFSNSESQKKIFVWKILNCTFSEKDSWNFLIKWVGW